MRKKREVAMSKINLIVFILLLFGILVFSAPSQANVSEETGNSCVNCHAGLPGSSFVGTKSHAWKGSIHQQNSVTCDKCHGGNPLSSDEKKAHEGVLGSGDPQSTVYYKNIPSTCGKCHSAEVYKFTQSFHYKRLVSTGRGPDCVTCHGSMVTTVLSPDTIATVCERCHNDRMGIFPYVPQKAKAVLLLLRESGALFDAESRIYHPSGGTQNDEYLRDARSSLNSARLEWHRFDLDIITRRLQEMYNTLKRLSPEKDEK
jgi:hypothetical protein